MLILLVERSLRSPTNPQARFWLRLVAEEGNVTSHAVQGSQARQGEEIMLLNDITFLNFIIYHELFQPHPAIRSCNTPEVTITGSIRLYVINIPSAKGPRTLQRCVRRTGPAPRAEPAQQMVKA